MVFKYHAGIGTVISLLENFYELLFTNNNSYQIENLYLF